MQINISDIINGYLVMTPPKPATIKFANQQQAQEQQAPLVMFCDNTDEVCAYIKTILES